MSQPLRVLLVEDEENDALLTLRALKTGGFQTESKRVDTAEAMTMALVESPWDIIISDYSMPKFSGTAALTVLWESGLDVPFIVVSGNIGEDVAVAMMKAGANDYMIKGQLARLAPAVRRELREAEQRRQRKLTEHALRESDERFRQITENVADLIALLDPDGRRIYSNPAYSALLGGPHHKLGVDSFDDVHEEDRERIRQIFTETIRTGIGQRVEYRFIAHDGSVRQIETQGSVIRDASNRITNVLLVGRDVTERRQAEREIQEANRMKSEFLASMSHELRTPLNGIIGFSELLVDGKAGELTAKQKDFLSDILSSGRHLLSLINDVLDLSKVEAGKMELFPEPFPLPKIVTDVCSIVSPMATKKNITIRKDISTAIESVTLDLQKFKQVLFNLLSNAVKFTDDRGRVDIIATLDAPNRLRLQVRDNGIGIKPADLKNLFVEFQQVDSHLARRHHGTGLGLALTKKIVEFQKGTITVESELGKGSNFTVVLPLNSEKADSFAI